MGKNKNDLIGEIGCFLSHIDCWETIVTNKMKHTLILEDGILFDKECFNETIHSSDSYNIIFANKEMIKQKHTLTGYGLQAYIVSNNGPQKLLKNCPMMYMPIDLHHWTIM